MKNPKYIIEQSKDDQFYFTLQAKNGEIVLTSEMYITKQSAQKGINAIKSIAALAPIEDLTL